MSQTNVREPSTWNRVYTYRETPFDSVPQADGRGIRQLLRDLSREVTTLVRQEVALAKVEISEKAAIAGRNALYLIIGGLVAYAGFLVLLGAIALGIAAWMAWGDVSPGVFLWLAPLIVAVVALIVGGALVAKAVATIKEEGLAPRRTAESIRDAREFVKEKIS